MQQLYIAGIPLASRKQPAYMSTAAPIRSTSNKPRRAAICYHDLFQSTLSECQYRQLRYIVQCTRNTFLCVTSKHLYTLNNISESCQPFYITPFTGVYDRRKCTVLYIPIRQLRKPWHRVQSHYSTRAALRLGKCRAGVMNTLCSCEFRRAGVP